MKTIIAIGKFILDLFFKLIGNSQATVEHSQSVEQSYAEQEKARLEAEKAKQDALNQGTPEDIFGSDKWNEKEKK